MDEHFRSKVEIPRIRAGKSQEVETLINDEALMLAQFLRNEKPTWKARIARLS